MFKEASLDHLKEGQKCIVDEIAVSGDIKRRLMDLGVVKNAVIECGLSGVGGSIKAFYIKGALIALRKEEFSKIYIRAYDEPEELAERRCADE